MIIGTCGHKLKDMDSGVILAIKEYDKPYERCIDYVFVCKRCAKKYKNCGYVADTKEDEMNWLKGDE